MTTRSRSKFAHKAICMLLLQVCIYFNSLRRDYQRLTTQLTRLTEAFAHVRVLIYKNFGGYDIAEGQKGGDEVRVAELLRQMVDEEVATLGALDLLVRAGELCLLRRRCRGSRSRRERGEP